MFTVEELRAYGADSIEELRGTEGLLVEWPGIPQCLAVSDTFFNCHLTDGSNQLLDEDWRAFWTLYVDDAL